MLTSPVPVNGPDQKLSEGSSQLKDQLWTRPLYWPKSPAHNDGFNDENATGRCDDIPAIGQDLDCLFVWPVVNNTLQDTGISLNGYCVKHIDRDHFATVR